MLLTNYHLENEPWKNDIEYLNLISDIIATPQVQKLELIIHHHISTRLQHSLRVSYLSYKIAKKQKLDFKAVARGGLLHDLFFFSPKDVNFKRSAKFVHPRIALRNAQKITTLSQIEKDIILHHMFFTGISTLFDMPKTKEGMLVTLIDKRIAKYEASIMLKKNGITVKH